MYIYQGYFIYIIHKFLSILMNYNKNFFKNSDILDKTILSKNNVYILEKYNFFNVLENYSLTYLYLDRYLFTIFLNKYSNI